MKVYLFKFDTNYGEAGIIVTTVLGLEHAKKLALEQGAWDTNCITELSPKEGAITSVNFGVQGNYGNY